MLARQHTREGDPHVFLAQGFKHKLLVDGKAVATHQKIRNIYLLEGSAGVPELFLQVNSGTLTFETRELACHSFACSPRVAVTVLGHRGPPYIPV